MYIICVIMQLLRGHYFKSVLVYFRSINGNQKKL